VGDLLERLWATVAAPTRNKVHGAWIEAKGLKEMLLYVFEARRPISVCVL
jgi:hypothetical protein